MHNGSRFGLFISVLFNGIFNKVVITIIKSNTWNISDMAYNYSILISSLNLCMWLIKALLDKAYLYIAFCSVLMRFVAWGMLLLCSPGRPQIYGKFLTLASQVLNSCIWATISSYTCWWFCCVVLFPERAMCGVAQADPELYIGCNSGVILLLLSEGLSATIPGLYLEQIKFRTQCMLGKYSTSWATPPVLHVIFVHWCYKKYLLPHWFFFILNISVNCNKRMCF